MNLKIFGQILVGIFVVNMVCKAQSHWESLVISSDTFKYLEATAPPPSGWKNIEFDDTGWKSGPGGIVYGDGDDATIIESVNSLYLRKEFTIHTTDEILDLLLHIDYDDGFWILKAVFPLFHTILN